MGLPPNHFRLHVHWCWYTLWLLSLSLLLALVCPLNKDGIAWHPLRTPVDPCLLEAQCFLERQGWFAEKLYVTLWYQFLASQNLTARRFRPLVRWWVWWFIIISKLFLQFICTSLFRGLNHDIFSFLWDIYVHILWYFCLWQSHAILQTNAYICLCKNRNSDEALIQPRFVRNLKEHLSQRFWMLLIVFSLFIVAMLHIIVFCQLYICSWALWLIALIKYHIMLSLS